MSHLPWKTPRTSSSYQEAQDTNEAIKRFLCRAPRWSLPTLDRHLRALAGEIQADRFVPWWVFRDTGLSWATHPEAVRLFDAAARILAPLQDTMHRGLFEGGRQTAINEGSWPLFEHLTQADFDWTVVDQAKNLLQILDETPPNPVTCDWIGPIWASIPIPDQPRIYCATAELASSLPQGADHLLILHASSPQKRLEHLESGVTALFWTSLEADLVDGLPQEVEQAWQRVRHQVRAQEIWEGLWSSMATPERTPFEPNAIDAVLADLILADVAPSLQDIWLSRPELTLPRTQAARRHHALVARAPRLSNTRRSRI